MNYYFHNVGAAPARVTLGAQRVGWGGARGPTRACIVSNRAGGTSTQLINNGATTTPELLGLVGLRYANHNLAAAEDS